MKRIVALDKREKVSKKQTLNVSEGQENEGSRGRCLCVRKKRARKGPKKKCGVLVRWKNVKVEVWEGCRGGSRIG